MPTPNLYAAGCGDTFAHVPPELQSNQVEVLYVTDRAPDGESRRGAGYGYGRCRSTAFGTVNVRFGREVSWSELVKASCSRLRGISLRVRVDRAVELGRFPPTPPRWVRGESGVLTDDPDSVAREAAAGEALKGELSNRLARGSCKDVFLYVHGFNNTFQNSVEVIAELWHFLGRRGVPLAYSWPAGSGGLRGYPYDRESGEFTVFHLKHLLRLLGECGDVRRVHVIAHSRGTDVALTALRELHLELGADAEVTREALRLGTLVLAAPDIDLDVALQRLAAEWLFRVPEASVVYMSEGDWALRLANWLFLGVARFGRLRPSELPPDELEVLQASENIQLIDTREASTGLLGHSDFYWSPAVSSDLILVLRDGRRPGAAHGRPLFVQTNGFWRIDSRYPKEGRHHARR